ncbi:MAG: hypothetical protein ACTSQI_09795 [Candidatus Helarchaeota archaeon]
MDKKILEVLKDLSFINAVIATELIRITENTAQLADKAPEKIANCQREHQQLNEQIINLVEKYNPSQLKILKSHVLSH